MKQSTTTSSSKESSLLASATEDEIIVSQILLDLRNLMSLSESLSNFNWGRKRRRSCLDAAPPLPPWLPPPVHDGIEERRPHIKAEEDVEEKPDAARTTASPDTPLSFSPSESDEKSKHSSKKTSKKRSKQEYIDMIEGLTQRKDLLRGEIENVKKYYNKLKAYNSELNAIKQEVLNTYPRKKEGQMETGGGVNLGAELTQHYRVDMVAHQQPLIQDPMAQNFHQYPLFGPIGATQFYSSSNSGLGSVNHVGPLGIDLNIPAEEALLGVDPSQPSDAGREIADKRARFAEARRKRRGIIKIKSMRSACGIKLPTTR
ncbi:hypothetical protein Salat_0625100 [Sesamum alatum]|uniref:Uncharacterized protein n=1 Tax=Sesamum alatum TaxID=300844 RepID=A0AAE1YS22_9LAMI|nr:hypothetical protein Salat_0625100 [Sesamum alatum]